MQNSDARRILVVDDERSIADTLTAILLKAGYDASARYDAQNALDHCAFRVPHLVISDVMMPGIDGVSLAIRITQRHAACRILLFSGFASSFDLVEEAALKGYPFELLEKPIHPVELLAKLAADFKRWFPLHPDSQSAAAQDLPVFTPTWISSETRQSERS